MSEIDQARAAMRQGDEATARALLMQLVRGNPYNGEAWHLLASVIDDSARKLDCLNRAAAAGYTEPATPPTPPVREMFPCPRCAESNPAGANFCSRCALAFNAPAPQPAAPPQAIYIQQAPEKRKGINWLGIILVSILGVVGTFYFLLQGVGTTGDTSGRSSFGASSAPRSVTYEVSGTATRASLTYQNASGGTEQADVSVPWKKTISVKAGTFLYLSVQNNTSSGSITCKIMVDKKQFKISTSSGAYKIASCDGLAP